uniref:hypothetical protein n=1 Tax=Flavobacterium sp. TaxID=239 RepID=UPI00404782B0
MKNIILVSFFTILLFSCNNSNNKKNEQDEISTVKVDSFEYKLKNESKIFLKYWSGMSYDEYIKVCELLVKDQILKKEGNNFFYVLGKGYKNVIGIYPSYLNENSTEKLEIETVNEGDNINKKIDGILLGGINEENYVKFKNKYNLEILQKVSNFKASKSLNPLYKDFKTNNDISLLLDDIEVKKILKENFEGLYECESELFYPSPSEFEKLLIKEAKIIKKNNNVVIIDNFNFYRKDIIHDYVLYKKENWDDKSYKENNKYIVHIWYIHSTDICVLYLSKKVYEEYFKSINNKKAKLEKTQLDRDNYYENREAESNSEI